MRGRLRHYYKVALRAAIFSLLRPVLEGFRLLPPAAAGSLGRFLGTVVFYLVRPGLRRPVENLSRAFPEMDLKERRKIIRRQMGHLGFVYGEFLGMTRRAPALLDRLVEVDNFEPVARAVQSGRGAVVLTAHLGSWELAAAAVGARVPRLAVVARELYDPALDRLNKRLRGRFKVNTIDSRDTRGMIRLLRSGGVLGVLADQDSRRVVNARLPFFGADAATPVGPARLAEHAGAVLVTGFIVRDGPRYRLYFEEMAETGSAEDRMAEYNRRLEDVVRKYPEQWLWLHDRWRSGTENN